MSLPPLGTKLGGLLTSTKFVGSDVNVTIEALTGTMQTSRVFFILVVIRNGQQLQYYMANNGHNQPGPQVPNAMPVPKIPQTFTMDVSNFLDENTGAPYSPQAGDTATCCTVEKAGGWESDSIGISYSPYPPAPIGSSAEGFSSGIPISFTLEPWWILLALVLLLLLVFHNEVSSCVASVSKSIGVSKLVGRSRR
jgi:hypothetical protein